MKFSKGRKPAICQAYQNLSWHTDLVGYWLILIACGVLSVSFNYFIYYGLLSYPSVDITREVLKHNVSANKQIVPSTENIKVM